MQLHSYLQYLGQWWCKTSCTSTLDCHPGRQSLHLLPFKPNFSCLNFSCIFDTIFSNLEKLIFFFPFLSITLSVVWARPIIPAHPSKTCAKWTACLPYMPCQRMSLVIEGSTSQSPDMSEQCMGHFWDVLVNIMHLGAVLSGQKFGSISLSNQQDMNGCSWLFSKVVPGPQTPT